MNSVAVRREMKCSRLCARIQSAIGRLYELCRHFSPSAWGSAIWYAPLSGVPQLKMTAAAGRVLVALRSRAPHVLLLSLLSNSNSTPRSCEVGGGEFQGFDVRCGVVSNRAGKH